MTLVEKAIKFAVDAHAGVLDKGGQPYILHPLRVLIMAQQLGLDEVAQAIAVLHDVVEDTSVTLEDIEREFGVRVRDGVDALTRRYYFPDSETYMQFVARAAQNADARKIKPIDNADNMRPERRVAGLKLPLRYEKSLRYLTNACFIAGDGDYMMKFRRLATWTL
jgi:(p)ppGpp synthase/HD superfamily hydrolase